MIDKILQALKDWRVYIVFVTFLVFILVVPHETIEAIQNFVGGLFHA